MRSPDPLNDDLGLEDADLFQEIGEHAKVIVEGDEEIAVTALRVCRMRDLLQEYLGKPIDHPDLRQIYSVLKGERE